MRSYSCRDQDPDICRANHNFLFAAKGSTSVSRLLSAPVWVILISASAGANSLVTHMEGARPLQTKAPICCESIVARIKIGTV
jgi:hypothetical protein